MFGSSERPDSNSGHAKVLVQEVYPNILYVISNEYNAAVQRLHGIPSYQQPFQVNTMANANERTNFSPRFLLVWRSAETDNTTEEPCIPSLKLELTWIVFQQETQVERHTGQCCSIMQCLGLVGLKKCDEKNASGELLCYQLEFITFR